MGQEWINSLVSMNILALLNPVSPFRMLQVPLIHEQFSLGKLYNFTMNAEQISYWAKPPQVIHVYYFFHKLMSVACLWTTLLKAKEKQHLVEWAV